MTDDTVTPVDIDDDLESFENEFFGKTSASPTAEQDEPEDEAEDEDVDENEDDPLATENDDDEDQDEDEDEDYEEEDEPEPKPEPKKNKTQLRIEKLVAEAREAERRAEALEKRLAELEASKEEAKDEAPKGLREQLPENAPDPDAKNNDGEPVYPLGEFDPNYIRDLTKFTIEQERTEARRIEQEEKQKAEIEAAQQEIQTNWLSRLEEAEKEIPDIRENITGLTEAFGDLEPAYGDYLATTIMSSEYGPQIMNYLSQNIGEAQAIVASGPAAATLALGRLEARLMKPVQDEPKRNKKVSSAPTPPEKRSRGAQGKFTTAPDTDDLDAFEREFFKRR